MLKKLSISILLIGGLVACSTTQKNTAAAPKSENVTAAAPSKSDVATETKTEKTPKKGARTKSIKVDNSASSEAKTSANTLNCASGSDKRILEISKTEKGGCELNYNKNGQASKIADQINGTNHCEEVQEKIKAKLQSAGFSCS